MCTPRKPPTIGPLNHSNIGIESSIIGISAMKNGYVSEKNGLANLW
jgi:hypothetical protein